MDSNSMGPADFSALMGNNAGCNGGAWWLVILFLFAMMNGGFGWNRGGDYGQYASAASQQEILFGQRFSDIGDRINSAYGSLDNKIDRIGNGIADATFALNNSINGVQTVLGGAIGTEGRSLQMQLAESTCKIENAIHAEGEATRSLIQTNEIQALRDKVNALEADNRMCGVVRYPQQMVYASAGSPFCNYNGGGCGCGNI